MIDDIFKSEFHYQNHSEELSHNLTQPSKNAILERNQNIRNDGRKLDLGKGRSGGTWGRQVASIPFILFWEAIEDGFDLNNTDKDHAAKEMHRFLQTPAGKSCTLTE